MDRKIVEAIEIAETKQAPAKDEDAPFYERVPKGKFRPDKRAIANLDALPRPKAPPGRKTDALRDALGCEVPDCSLCGDK